MTAARASSLALVTPDEGAFDDVEQVGREPDGRERRAYARLDPLVLADPLIARVKYGDSVTLLDVSAGGALIETTAALRPDSTLVLEMMPAGAQDAMSVVARVVRCQVASVRGGIRYRGACAFKRPLDYPPLVAPAPAIPASDAFARPEVALKAVVEGHRRRAKLAKISGAPQDPSSLLDSLRKLQDAAEQRIDPIDRRVAQMLGAIVPALQRNESSDGVTGEVLVQLARHVPAMTIRVGGGSRPGAHGDAERVTLNVWSEPVERAMLTAEFPAGFDIDETQFRLLKAGAYLLGLAESWVPAAPALAPVPSTVVARAEEPEEAEEELPAGWQRIVVRFADGALLRGYTNSFHPDAAHLQLSPTLNTDPRERLLVPIVRLKAVFFVRNLAGNAEHVESNAFDHTPRARKVEVTFRDGEVVAGSTLNYKPDGQGFFLTPANGRGNNQRVYVVLAAVRHLRFL
jgi:hypothetical protein